MIGKLLQNKRNQKFLSVLLLEMNQQHIQHAFYPVLIAPLIIGMRL